MLIVIPLDAAASSIYFPPIDVFDKILPIFILYPKPDGAVVEYPIFILPVRDGRLAIFNTPDVCAEAIAIFVVVDDESIDDDFNVVIVSVPCAVG